MKPLTRTAFGIVSSALFLTGCGLHTSFEDFYRLPRLSDEYASLNTCLQALLDEGAEYAAPQSGQHLQSVQMVDLNGDGVNEAVAFLRDADDLKPLKTVILTQENNSYQPAAVLEHSGTAFHSISYADLNGDGWQELLIGIGFSADVNALSAYTISDYTPNELMHSAYVYYTTDDLNGDGLQELVLLTAETSRNCTAECYAWADNSLCHASSAPLSATVSELERLSAGTLSDGSRALFVTSVQDADTACTDILLLQDHQLLNITPGGMTVHPWLELYPSDLNEDGITELPVPVTLPTLDPEETSRHLICWQSCGADGAFSTLFLSYHNRSGGWYLLVPESWQDCITVQELRTGDDATTTFYLWSDRQSTLLPFLEILATDSDSVDPLALPEDQLLLASNSTLTYTARLLPANSRWSYGLNAETLLSRFHLISVDWTLNAN